MNLILGIVWSLVTLTVATEPLVDRHQPDANNGDAAVHHEIRQLEAAGFAFPGSSLITQNNVIVAIVSSITGKLFSNATSSASPSFISVTPTSFLNPAPIPKKTISTLVTVETVNLPQETSTQTDVVLTTSPAAPSTTGSFKDVVGDTLGDQKTSKETALPESSSAPVEIATTVTLIPIEASSSQTSDSSTTSAPSSQVMQTSVSSIAVPTAPTSSTDLPSTSASTASFTSIRVVGTPISNPSSPNIPQAGESYPTVQVSDSVSTTSASVITQASQGEAQLTAPPNDANSLLTISSMTTRTTTRFTTTTVTDGTVTSTVTLLDASSTQSSIPSITSQSLIGKLPSGGPPPGETIIEMITSGGSTYTTTETAPGSTLTRSIVINPAYYNSASSVPHLSSNTAAGLTKSSSALPSCTCPTPQTVTVTQTVSLLSSTASFIPQVSPSDGFVGVPVTTSISAVGTNLSSKSSGIPESIQSTTRSYPSWSSFPPATLTSSLSLAIIPVYASSSSVGASLSKATPYPNSTIPVSTSGNLLGTAIQPPPSASSTHSYGQLPSGTHLSVTPVPKSTSPLTSTGAADFRRVSNGAEGVALVVGFVALILLF